MAERVKLGQVYYEIRVYGKYLRVHAIDPDSGEEAIATGLASIGQHALKRNAKQRLEYLLTKKRKQAIEDQNRPDD